MSNDSIITTGTNITGIDTLSTTTEDTVAIQQSQEPLKVFHP